MPLIRITRDTSIRLIRLLIEVADEQLRQCNRAPRENERACAAVAEMALEQAARAGKSVEDMVEIEMEIGASAVLRHRGFEPEKTLRAVPAARVHYMGAACRALRMALRTDSAEQMSANLDDADKAMQELTTCLAVGADRMSEVSVVWSAKLTGTGHWFGLRGFHPVLVDAGGRYENASRENTQRTLRIACQTSKSDRFPRESDFNLVPVYARLR